MGASDDQMCVISLFFPCPDDNRAMEIKAAIQKLVEDVDARLELRLMDGKVKGPGPHV